MIHYLDDLLSGRESRFGGNGVSCKFVHAKMKSKSTCVLLGHELEEIQCFVDPSNPEAYYTMDTIEPGLDADVPSHKNCYMWHLLTRIRPHLRLHRM